VGPTGSHPAPIRERNLTAGHARSRPLAEILCDLEWRRHVALADYDHAVTQFYRRIARHLGQPARFGDLLCCPNRIDPLESWIIEHRRRFRAVRERHWRTARFHNPILPTIRHFK